MPNRREYLVLSAIASKVGLAGCLSNDAVPGGGSNDDNGSEETDSDDSDQEDSDDIEGEEEEDEEDEEEDEEDTEPRIVSDLDDIFSEMRWFENEYTSASSEYRSEIQTAVDNLRTALDPIQDVDMVTVDEFDEISDVVQESTENAVDALEPQYDNVYNVAGLSRNRLPDIRRYIDVRDWDAAEEELEEFIRVLRSVSTSRYVENNYPEKPIVNRLHDWLGDDVDLHEFRVIGDQVDHRNTGYDAPGFGRFVVGDLEMEPRYDPLDDTNPYNPLVGVQEDYEPFSVTDSREFSIYYRAHTVNDSETPDPRESENISSVYIQRYESQDDVESAFEILTETVTVEDEFVSDGETWHQVTIENSGSLYYAYAFLSGRYMITFGISRDIWGDRGDDYHEQLRDTFLLPDSVDEDLVEEGWPL